MAAAGDLADAVVLEVGPGPGGLTRALLEAEPRRVVAIERDPRWMNRLRDLPEVASGRLELIEGDALTLGLATVARGARVRIVANLPYNVATPLLMRWLDEVALVELMVLMFQKEVALRLCAAPGSPDYGRLSVAAQLVCQVERRFDLPAAAFHPPPKVASSVVRLVPRVEQPPAAVRRALASVTRAAFGQRRKMLRASLRALDPAPDRLLDRAGIVPTRRAEELSVEEFRRLAETVLAAA